MAVFHSILIPTDLSPHAYNAFEFAKTLASDKSANLHLLYVVSLPELPETIRQMREHDHLITEMTRIAEEELHKLVQEAQAAGFQAYAHVIEGVPSEAILDYVENHAIDIIVQGKHDKNFLERLIFGSASETIIRKAPCPVIVVPEPKQS